MFSNKKSLLLDMNGTFMFGEDNFGNSEDFSNYYIEIGGSVPKKEINHIIRSIYAYLNERYPNEKYRHNFPSIKSALENMSLNVPEEETSKIVETFAHHEIGHIPDEYIEALHALNKKFQLAVVIDIWAPKQMWLNLFKESGIDKLFSASSFSSDHGTVKPSPKPFELVVKQLGIKKDQCLVIGDSIRRDLGGAQAAGIDCVLVGGTKHANAIACYDNLLIFCEKI